VTRTTVRYGTGRGRVGELWLPEAAAAPAGDLPVVVLVHGGFWRAQYTKVLMRRLARSVTEHGWAAWNIEYRRVGRFGGGGGWPATFADVAAAVDALEQQTGLDLDRVVTCGHSAGGQLALWLAARHRLGDEAPDAPGGPARVTVHAAVALAGVVDLRRADELGLGGGAVASFLGGSADAVPERYECTSPMARLPLGVPQVLVHGLADTVVPPAMSEEYVTRAMAGGDDARYVPVPGETHSDMLAPSSAGWAAALEHLERLTT
jgi:acetyl esterase/lipase